ncbi:MAG: class I SAM-dependent methyltransferase [Candidatus Nezhaarchaeales archaeon]
MNGLKERWERVERALEDLLPVYEVANRVMSFGMAHKWRKLAVKLVAKRGLRVLDEGCGPGAMTAALIKECNPELVVCMDYSLKMVKPAKGLGGQLVVGVFERAPFKPRAFDLVICGFSLRDAMDLGETIREQHRMLKPRGQVLVLDIMKPDRSIALKLYGFYWLIIAPLLVAPLTLHVGGPIKYLALYESYRRLPTISSLKAMYRRLFKKVFVFPIVNHMVAALIARKGLSVKSD